jgi:beta-lactam-binding protein with PASTA domain
MANTWTADSSIVTADSSQFTADGLIAGGGALMMPNVIGKILFEAISTLQAAGVLVPSQLGYFSIYPISARWVPSTVNRGVVTGQSLAAGLTATVNQAITLTVNDYPFSVSFP